VIRRQDQLENNTKDLVDYQNEFNSQKQPEPDSPTTPEPLSVPTPIKRKKSLAELLLGLFPHSSQSEYNANDFL
jgi:hypothetical protein